MRIGSMAALVAVAIAVTGCSVGVEGRAFPDPAASGPEARPTPSAPFAPTTTTARSSSDPFEDAQRRFGLVPPPGWTVDTGGTQGTAAVFVDPRPTGSGPFRANVNVIVAPALADLPTTVVGARRELQGLDEYQATVDQPFTLDDGTPAHVLGGTFSDPRSAEPLRNLQLFAVHDGDTVVATGTSLVEAWADDGPELEASLRTLTVDQ